MKRTTPSARWKKRACALSGTDHDSLFTHVTVILPHISERHANHPSMAITVTSLPDRSHCRASAVGQQPDYRPSPSHPATVRPSRPSVQPPARPTAHRLDREADGGKPLAPLCYAGVTSARAPPRRGQVPSSAPSTSPQARFGHRLPPYPSPK